ncbi:MAG: fatty acid desaturase CarF family protein [Gammaproteobacteria bacterium]
MTNSFFASIIGLESQLISFVKSTKDLWEIFIKIIFCILIADFISGFFHWLEDTYGEEDWPIVGSLIIKPNVIHHLNVRHFLKNSWFTSARVLLLIGLIVIYALYLLNSLNWMVFLTILIGINANEIHKWAHRSESENGKVITALQKLTLIQTPHHHCKHHINKKDTHYCIITNYLNVVLDRLKVWRIIEIMIYIITGNKPRDDSEKSLKDYI